MPTTYYWKDESQTITGSQPLDGRSQGSLRIVRTGWCRPYTGTIPMVADLLGGYRLFGRRIVLIPPMRHPLFTWCRATDIQIEPFESMQYTSATERANIAGLRRIALPRKKNFGTEGKARVQITYTLPTLNDDANQEGNNADENMAIASESWNFSARSLTIPGRFYKWKFSGPINPVQYSDNLVKKDFAEVEYQLVRHRCLTIPFNCVAALTGTINYNPIKIINTTFPAETLLFLGLAATRQLTTAQGFPFYELTYRFKIKPNVDFIQYTALGAGGVLDTDYGMGFVGWNRIYNFSTGLWERWVEGLLTGPGVGRGLYLYDTDKASFVLRNGSTVAGFKTLFDPRAR